ncbi:acyl-CoA thioesterase [Streptomyces sp. NPDC050485]|uniref:acyl-CoA thioesterase n=1 Tax=Streptomyces sp. NPDC050485 TaxID=3365617 RepID=UPI0037B07B5D
MKLIDDAAAPTGRHAGGPAVSVSADRMTFLLPVRAGDLMSVHACVEYEGLTSMDVGVRATAERWNASGPTTEVATARLTFVAIGENGSPRPVLDLRLVTAEDHQRHLHALQPPGAWSNGRPRAERGTGRRWSGAPASLPWEQPVGHSCGVWTDV